MESKVGAVSMRGQLACLMLLAVPLLVPVLLLTGRAEATSAGRSDDVSWATMERSIMHLGPDTSLRNERRCGTKDIRKESALENLRDCTVIEGNLLLAIMSLRRDNWYFPKLKEVTGYVLIYFVSSLTVMGMFPNLVVIRGQSFLYNYAFIVKDCQMEYLSLYSLRLIQRGGVRIEENSQLCHMDSIDWKRLTTQGVSPKDTSWAGSELPWQRWQHTGRTSKENMIYLINNRRLCPGPCPINCPRARLGSITRELCWSHKACQSICKVKCPFDAPCHMLHTDRCCHRECLAGCYGPDAHECVTCKNVLHEGQCVEMCPPGFYKFLDRRCVTKEECFQHRTKDPNNYANTMPYVIMNGTCVPTCPPQFNRSSTTGHCEPCRPSCPKRCSVALIYSIRDSERISGCASIRNLYISIRDGGQGALVIQELKKNFEHLRVVEQSLRVVRSFSLQSLSFLSNLREIRGEMKKDRDNDFISEDKVISFEVIGNERLESLWDIPAGEKLVIHRGQISINMNRQLCSDKVLKFIDNSVEIKGHNLTQAERHFITKANGDLMPCNVTKLKISVRGIRSRQAALRWPRVRDNERKLVTMLMMIKPAQKNISVSFDRASCDANSWKALDATCLYHSGSEDFCSFIIHQLQPATRYALYVEAKTVQGGSGAISDIVYLNTKPETPSRPINVRIEPLSAFSLKVTWQPPKYPHGIIRIYRIRFRRLGVRYKDYTSRNFCDRKIMQSLLSAEHKYYDEERSSEQQLRLHFNSSTSCKDCKQQCARRQELVSLQDDQTAFENKLMQHIFNKKPDAKVESLCDFPVPSMGAESLNSVPPTGEGFTNLSNFRRAWNRGSVSATPGLASPAGPSSEPEKDDERSETVWKGPIKLNAATLRLENGKFSHVIAGLSHFSEYVVELQACQAPSAAAAVDFSTCSARARGLHRTLPFDAADNVDQGLIQVAEPSYASPESGSIGVKWRRPARPNGPVLYYILRYRLRQRRADPWNTKCLTAQDWAHTPRDSSFFPELTSDTRPRRTVTSSQDDDAGLPLAGGLLLYNLRPGEYEFQIKAVSLADKGNWTQSRTFYILDMSKPANTTIVIICVSIVVLAVLIIFGVFFKCYRDQRRRRKELIYGRNCYSIVYREDEWEIKPIQLEINTPLGQGTFGMVHRGLVLNLNTPAKRYMPGGEALAEDQPLARVEAAVKTVRRNSSFDDKKAFLMEAASMKCVRSYHIVRLLGVVSAIQNPKVAMEFMLHADLARYLCEHVHKDPPDGQRLLRWAAQIADGMAYLATKKIVHRDLAARNCLLDANLTAKIGDFGLARAMNYHDYYQKRGQAKLPFRWMAPETLGRGTCTVYSDVWSYGVVLWEMTTFAAVPYHNLNQEAVIEWVRKGHTLLAPGRGAMENIVETWREEPCPQILLDLMSSCFTFAYLERPTFVEILDRLSPHLPPDVLRRSFYTCGLTPEEDLDDDLDHLSGCAELKSNGTRHPESPDIPLRPLPQEPPENREISETCALRCEEQEISETCALRCEA